MIYQTLHSIKILSDLILSVFNLLGLILSGILNRPKFKNNGQFYIPLQIHMIRWVCQICNLILVLKPLSNQFLFFFSFVSKKFVVVQAISLSRVKLLDNIIFAFLVFFLDQQIIFPCPKSIVLLKWWRYFFFWWEMVVALLVQA